jgi:transposase
MDVRDTTAGSRSWVRWRHSTPWRGFAGDEGDGRGMALGVWGRAQACLRRFGELSRGRNTGAEAPESAEHGEAV